MANYIFHFNNHYFIKCAFIIKTDITQIKC